MFTKEKEVGRGQYRVTKSVIDWGAVFAASFYGAIGLFLLAMCSG